MLEDSAALSLIWMIVITVAIIALAYWSTRYVAGRGILGGGACKGGGMEILARLPVGRNEALALVRVGERYFLLGVTAGSESTLAEQTKEDAAPGREAAQGTGGGQTPTFRESLAQVLRQRGRR